MMLDDVRADFERLTKDFPPLAECRPFSPEAYNAISAILMQHYYDAIESIAAEHGVEYHSNLAVALFCDLHSQACTHYFHEHERLHGMTSDVQSGDRRTRAQRNPGQPEVRRIARTLLQRWRALRQPAATMRVAYAGTTTFAWLRLQRALNERGARLSPTGSGRGNIPLFDIQRKHLDRWASKAHGALAQAMGTQPSEARPFGPGPVAALAEQLRAMRVAHRPRADLLVTGTLGALETRAAALNALSHGVPVMTFHHGGQFKNFDEPYYDLYEGQLPTAKLGYGDIARQRQLGTLERERNLAGRDILLYARTDDLTRKLRSSEPIAGLGSLNGKRVLYFPTDCEDPRYGPYRDVHPRTYLAWQQRLIAWLTGQTGRLPYVRLHPKRKTTTYEPTGCILNEGSLDNALTSADVYVLDYPTTTMSHATATNKPILFFDLGLRRLFPAALQALQQRCAYARVDVLDPEEGLAAMERDMQKTLIDAYSPIFTLAPQPTDEVAAAADAVVDALGKLS